MKFNLFYRAISTHVLTKSTPAVPPRRQIDKVNFVAAAVSADRGGGKRPFDKEAFTYGFGTGMLLTTVAAYLSNG